MPIVEYRSGFPYSNLNRLEDYVGVPNSARFPNYFSLDARFSKDFKLSSKYSIRLPLTGLNFTNHFNALAVHANTGDPQFGTFFGDYHRRYRGDFDFLF